MPNLKFLAIRGTWCSHAPEDAPLFLLDALQHTPLIFPQLEQLNAHFDFDFNDDKMYKVFEDIVRVWKGIINKICVLPKFDDKFIEILKANAICVEVSQPPSIKLSAGEVWRELINGARKKTRAGTEGVLGAKKYKPVEPTAKMSLGVPSQRKLVTNLQHMCLFGRLVLKK